MGGVASVVIVLASARAGAQTPRSQARVDASVPRADASVSQVDASVPRADASVPTRPACVLFATPTPARALPPELLRLAGQYFHPTHRGMFLDLIQGTSRYAHYDPRDPFTRGTPPPQVARAERSTDHFLIGTESPPAESTVVVNRATGATTSLRGGARLHVDDAVEAPNGALWILGETVDASGNAGPLMLFRGDNSAPPLALTNTRARTWWTAVLGVTRAGDVAVAWAEGDGAAGRISLRLAWANSAGHATPPREIDAVTLPASYVDLSVRTGTNVVLARDGDALVVAWRPLSAPAHPVSTGDASHPPQTPFAASVRILRATALGARLMSQHPTTVQPLGFTTGIGPWSLDPGGAWAFTLDGQAVVLWLDTTGAFASPLVAARATDTRPTVLVPNAGDTLLAVHSITGPRAIVYTYRSAPEFRAFEIGCRAGP